MINKVKRAAQENNGECVLEMKNTNSFLLWEDFQRGNWQENDKKIHIFAE